MSCEWVVCFIRPDVDSLFQGAGTRTTLSIISLRGHGVRWHRAATAEYVCRPPIHTYLLTLLSQVCHIAETSLHNVLDSDNNVAVLLSLHSSARGDHVVPDLSPPRQIKI